MYLILRKNIEYKINNAIKKSHNLKNNDDKNKMFKLYKYKHSQRVNLFQQNEFTF